MMTQPELTAYLTELERRFVARSESPDILAALPAYRVGRSEMRAWFATTFGRDLDLDDVLQLDHASTQAYKRLRKRFPSPLW